jgi:cytochrome c oxidase subunit II
MQMRFLKLSFTTLLFTLVFSMSHGALNIETSATGLPVSEETINAGETLFKAKCSACHNLDRKMTGPALKGITERRDIDWLHSWIRDNVSLRESGNADAIAVYNKFNKTAMNAFPNLTDLEINSILMYTENGPVGKGPAPATAEAANEDPSLFNKTNWLLLLLSLIVFIVVIVIVKTIDMVGRLTGREVIPWNNVNAVLMLLFLILGMAAGLYELSIHSKYLLLSNSSSAHGADIDNMMKITFIITGFVFFVTHICLFGFAFKYRKKEGVKALYYPDNDKLELVWTIIPAIVLTVLVLGGLNTWQKVTKAPEEGTPAIEVFAHQFAWKVRYPGADGELGKSNYNLISEKSNELGIAIEYKAEEILIELEDNLSKYERSITKLPADLGKLKAGLGGLVGSERSNQLKQIYFIESGAAESDIRLQIRRRHTQIQRIKSELERGTLFTEAAFDDIIGDEIHLVVNQPITLKLRSRDVIHSALMKEFRSQMNLVPGIPTQVTLTPNKTTKERRDELGNQEFDYHIICNKICGNSHYNMKIKIVVEDQDAYNSWMSLQKATFTRETEPVNGGSEDSEATPAIILN